MVMLVLEEKKDYPAYQERTDGRVSSIARERNISLSPFHAPGQPGVPGTKGNCGFPGRGGLKGAPGESGM